MSGLALQVRAARDRFGLKGPRAADWLREQGIPVPEAANTWTGAPVLGTPATSTPGGARESGVAIDDMPGSARESSTVADTGNGAGEMGVAANLLVARLGTGEFFVEADAGASLSSIVPSFESHPPGVYPVLREDAAFLLGGAGTADVLAQVCNVDFAALVLDACPVIMTLMVGVAVLVVPQAPAGRRQYLIWCDPTFGRYLEETFGNIVIECGGSYRGVPG